MIVENNGDVSYKLNTPNIKLLCFYLLAVLSLKENYIKNIIELITTNGEYNTHEINTFITYLSRLLVRSGNNGNIPIHYEKESSRDMHEFLTTKSFAVNILCFLYSASDIKKAIQIQSNLNFLLGELFENNTNIEKFFRDELNGSRERGVNVFLDAFQDIENIKQNMRYTEHKGQVNINDVTMHALIKMGKIQLTPNNKPQVLVQSRRNSISRRWSYSSLSSRSNNSSRRSSGRSSSGRSSSSSRSSSRSKTKKTKRNSKN